MFKFSKTRDEMTFEADRPYVCKNLSPWEIDRIGKFVPELKNPCVDEWTLTLLPRELGWLVKPRIKRVELFNEGYVIFWEDGYFRELEGHEIDRIHEYMKNRTTFRLETIEYRDFPKNIQNMWKKR